jgi:hypothetical protein
MTDKTKENVMELTLAQLDEIEAKFGMCLLIHRNGQYAPQDSYSLPALIKLAREALNRRSPEGWVMVEVGTLLYCETCEGLGWHDETLGGFAFSNQKAPCPDCDGNGYRPVRAAPPK